MIDIDNKRVMGYCLHKMHTMKLSYKVYKSRRCSECRHFFPITPNASVIREDLTHENSKVDKYIDRENKTP